MFFDTHTHLDLLCQRTTLPLKTIVQQACRENVAKMLLTAVKSAQFAEFSQLIAPFSSHIKIGLGLHPLFILDHKKTDLDLLTKALQQRESRCCAVAEIGLDRSASVLVQPDIWQKQQAFCATQLDIAKQFNLPVSLHCRRSHNELLALLKRHSPKKKGVIHGFSGSVEQAKQFVDLGYFIGVGGVITYPRANKTRRAITQLPLDCLVLETDSPDMPIFGKQGQTNFPHCLPLIFKHLCELKGLKGDHIPNACQQLWKNSVHLFGE